MPNLSFALRCAGSILSGLLLSGCGDTVYEMGEVSGKVTCSGKPAWGGVLIFEPLDAPEKTKRPKGSPGRRSQGLVQEDGTFTLTYEPGGGGSASSGALTGPHRVTFIQPQSTPWKWNPQDDWLPAEEKEKLKAELAARPVYPELPCGDALTPGEVEVKAGGNSFEFTLAEGKPRPQRPGKQMGSN